MQEQVHENKFTIKYLSSEIDRLLDEVKELKKDVGDVRTALGIKEVTNGHLKDKINKEEEARILQAQEDKEEREALKKSVDKITQYFIGVLISVVILTITVMGDILLRVAG